MQDGMRRGFLENNFYDNILKRLSNLSVACFGFAFIKAYNEASFVLSGCLVESNPILGRDFLSISMLVTFAFFLMRAKRISPLYNRPWVVPMLFLMSISALLMIFSDPRTSIGFALGVVGIAISGGACAVAILIWTEFLSCFRLAEVVAYVSGGFFFGGVFGWLIEGLDPTKMVVALFLCALGSSLCIKIGYSQLPEELRPRKTSTRVRFPWRLVVILGVYEFIYGAQEGLGVVTWDLPGMMVASILVFALFELALGKLNFGSIVQMPFMIVALGLLVGLTGFVGPGVSGYLLSVGYSSMFIMLVIVFCDISHKYGVSAIVLCSIKDLMESFLVLGHGVGGSMFFGLIGGRPDVVAGVVVVAIIFVSLLLLAESRKPQWGLSFFGVDRSEIAKDPQAAFELRVSDMAEAYRLSPRETEVFRLIAAGREAPFIERELGIAKGTLKSHTQRIYQKLGVHSRQELRDAVGAGGVGPGGE